MMDNDDVITELGLAIAQLDIRETELKGWQNNLPGPVFDLPAQLNALYKQQSQLTLANKDLRIRKVARERVRELEQEVKALTEAQRTAMAAALQAVSTDVSAANNFKAALALAASVATAAAKLDQLTVIA